MPAFSAGLPARTLVTSTPSVSRDSPSLVVVTPMMARGCSSEVQMAGAGTRGRTRTTLGSWAPRTDAATLAAAATGTIADNLIIPRDSLGCIDESRGRQKTV